MTEQIRQPIHDRRQFEIAGLQCQLLGFQRSEFHQPGDQTEELIRRPLHRVEVLRLPGIGCEHLRHFCHADNGIQGCTQLVTHVTQEVNFGLVGRLGRLGCNGQGHGPLEHKRFQPVAVFLDLFAQVFAFNQITDPAPNDLHIDRLGDIVRCAQRQATDFGVAIS